MTEPTALIMGREFTQDEFLDFIARKGPEVSRRAETDEIELGGRTYTFRKPKTAIMLAALMQSKGKSPLESSQIMAEMQLKWIRSGVGKEAWAGIEQRLMDEDDDLDWDDIDDVFKTKTSQIRPTTSSSESSAPSPTTTPSADAPKPPESIFGI